MCPVLGKGHGKFIGKRTWLFIIHEVPWNFVRSERLLLSSACRHSDDQFWILHIAWWRHLMETFSALLALCAGNSPVTGEFSAQRQVMRSFDVFFDQRLNKRLSKQSWGWWLETPSRPLWRHSNGHGWYLTHWGWDKMAAISQTTLSNAFSWKKMYEFRLKFHWSVFLRVQLTILHHWCR